MPKSKIDATLRSFAVKPSDAKSKNSTTSEPASATVGDPNCPLCHGIGYLRQDLPLSDPNFGRVEICDCRKEQVARQVKQQLYAISHLDELKDLTFGNFQTQRNGLVPIQAESLQTAFNRARQYAANLKGWMLLQGGYGCGKTHLAAAISNYVVSMGVPTLFLTVPDLLDELRFSYNSQSTTFEQRFEEIRNAPFLVLDDFGTQNATDWAQEKLFQVVNFRYINHLPLLVTTNLELSDIEARIRSRLMDAELVSIVHINAPDHRIPGTDITHHELSSLALHEKQTFASFDDRRGEGLNLDEVHSLEAAVKAATAFAARPRGWLLLTGPYFCGKTHLAAAIANAISEKGMPPLFIMVPDLLDHLRATFSPGSMVSLDRRFEEVRSAPVLFLDDLGAQSASPWAREKMHQLFNARYIAELPTVFTLATEMMDTLDDRLRVRLTDDRLCKICTISAPAYKGGRRKKGK